MCVQQVYPVLSEGLQKEWDEAEQALYEELITEQVTIVLHRPVRELVNINVARLRSHNICFSGIV